MKLLTVENAAMEQAIQNWRNWLLSEKSLGTVSAYEWDMRALARRFPAKGPGDYKLTDLTAYQAERRFAGVGDQARKRAACAMRGFFRHTVGASRSPAKKLPLPKPKRKSQRHLTWDQAARVLETCETTRPLGVRNLAIMALMLEAGFRCAEVCRLELGKTDLARQRATVIVKGGDELDGSFDALTAEYIHNWIEVRKAVALPTTGTLFCSVGGLTPGARLTTEGLRSIFRKIGRDAGLDKLSPHDFRRTCGNLKMLMGASDRMVQEGLRLDDPKQVRTYTRGIGLDQFARFHVVARVLGQTGSLPAGGDAKDER